MLETLYLVRFINPRCRHAYGAAWPRFFPPSAKMPASEVGEADPPAATAPPSVRAARSGPAGADRPGASARRPFWGSPARRGANGTRVRRSKGSRWRWGLSDITFPVAAE